MEPVQKLIGMNIKLTRISRSVAQGELASKLSIEQSYLSRIEKGSVPVSCERLYEIIHILKCDVTDIFPKPLEVETKFNQSDKE